MVQKLVGQEAAGMQVKGGTYFEWHKLRRMERHAPWKIFLPISSNASVLAIALSGNHLFNLALSYPHIHVHQCADQDLRCALRNAQMLGLEARFQPISNLGDAKPSFQAVAMNVDGAARVDPSLIFPVLESGGTVIWAGLREHLPSTAVLSAQGYQNVSRYVLLPAQESKVMIPLKDTRFTNVGLDFYIPSKWYHRAGLRMGRFLVGAGLQSELGKSQVLVARKPGVPSRGIYLLDWLSKRLGWILADVAVYIGWTKLVLQLIDANGKVKGIAKLADQSPGWRSLQRETETLRRLGTIANLQDSIPRILLGTEWENHFVQVQTALPLSHRAFTHKLKAGHIHFLAMLGQANKRDMYLAEWPIWIKLRQWAEQDGFESLREREIVRDQINCYSHELRGTKIGFHQIHGDFTPWHAFLEGNKLRVIDWEMSSELGLPFYDVAYFVLKQWTLLRGRDFSIEKVLDEPGVFAAQEQALRSFLGSSKADLPLTKLAILMAYLISKYPGFRDEIMDT